MYYYLLGIGICIVICYMLGIWICALNGKINKNISYHILRIEHIYYRISGIRICIVIHILGIVPCKSVLENFMFYVFINLK